MSIEASYAMLDVDMLVQAVTRRINGGGIAWRRIWIIGRRQRESETQGFLTRPSRRVSGIDKQQATGSRQARASNRKTLNLLDRGAVLGVVVQKKRRAGDGWMDMDWGWALSCGLTCRCEKTITQTQGGVRDKSLFFGLQLLGS